MAVTGLVACGDDDDDSVDAGGDAGATQGKPVKFAVPAKGGTVQVQSANGEMTTSFDFPASAAGQMVTLTPVPAKEIGWPEEQFAEVIRMEPDGAKFDQPIVIRPASGNVIVLDFPSSGSKSKPEPLQLNDKGDGFLLTHFSTLVVVQPENSCDGRTGWKVEDSATAKTHCTDPDYPTYITFSCGEPEYCFSITAECCAKPGAKWCLTSHKDLSVSFQQAPYSERYPYCGEKPATDAGSGGAGGARAGGSGGSGGNAGRQPEAGSGGAGQGGSGGTAGKQTEAGSGG
ncbi:MAG TPA: hypothetical protein VJR89_37410, partial [Polyangiales bacterium]|nr:hypothetical protein [Polyangiales bacterium]